MAKWSNPFISGQEIQKMPNGSHGNSSGSVSRTFELILLSDEWACHFFSRRAAC